MKLTRRQCLFAENFASGAMSGTAAARLAGYKNPDRYSYVLKKHEKVRAMIALIRLQTVSDPGAAYVARLALKRDLALKQGRFAEAVAVEIGRGRLLGLHPDQM